MGPDCGSLPGRLGNGSIITLKHYVLIGADASGQVDEDHRVLS